VDRAGDSWALLEFGLAGWIANKVLPLIPCSTIYLFSRDDCLEAWKHYGSLSDNLRDHRLHLVKTGNAQGEQDVGKPPQHSLFRTDTCT
jgi:hypothetical protein